MLYIYHSPATSSFKKFIEESTISDTLSKEEYTELCTEVGSKEEVGRISLYTMKYVIGRLYLLRNGL